MEYLVIYEYLRQLAQIYVYSEQQYICASANSSYPILQTFFEQRALERTSFIEELQSLIEQNNNGPGIGRTLDELYAWHTDLYGRGALHNWPVADLEVFPVDEKALKICCCLLETELPTNLRSLIRKHTITLESGILSLTYLKAIYHK